MILGTPPVDGNVATQQPYVPLSRYSIKPHVVRQIPEEFARSAKVVALERQGDYLTVAVTNPQNEAVLSKLKSLTASAIRPVLSSETEIELALERGHSSQGTIDTSPFISRTLVASGLALILQGTDPDQKEASQIGTSARKTTAGFATDEDKTEALALAAYLPRIRIDKFRIEPAFARLIPQDIAERWELIALFPIGEKIVIASSNLPPLSVLESIKNTTGYNPLLALCTPAEAQRALERGYHPYNGSSRSNGSRWEMLVEGGVINGDEVSGLEAVERQTGLPAESLLLRLGRVTEFQLLEARARYFGVQAIKLVPAQIDYGTARIVPEPIARRRRFLPLRRRTNHVQIAMVDPSDSETLALAEYLMGQPAKALACTEADLNAALDAVYKLPQEAFPTEKAGLDEYLLRSGRLSINQITEALRLQRKTGQELSYCFAQLKMLDQTEIVEFTALQQQMPWVNAGRFNPSRDTLDLVPEEFARQHRLVPLYREGQLLTIATHLPINYDALKQLEENSGLTVRVVLATEPAILECMDRVYNVDYSALSKELQLFGRNLVRKGALSREQLLEAFSHHLQLKVPFDIAVSSLGYLTEQQITQAFSEQLKLPIADLQYRIEPVPIIDGLGNRRERLIWKEPIDREVGRLLSEPVATKYGAVPFDQSGDTVSVAFANPLDDATRNAVQEHLQLPISAYVATRSQVMEAIRRIHNRRTIGDLLLETDIIDRRQLDEGLELHKRTGVRLGKALVSLGHVTQDQLVTCLSEQLNLPYFTISGVEISEEIVRSIPEALARQHGVFPLSRENGIVTLAMTDPLDIEAIQEVERLTECTVNPVITTEQELDGALEKIYRHDYLWTSANDLVFRYPEDSAVRVLTRPQKLIGIGFLVVSALMMIFYPIPYITFLVSLSTLFYLCFSTYKFYLIYKALSHKLEVDVSQEEIDALDDRDLPIYTILVPLYKEPEVLPILINAIDNMDYPKTKLDVKLLLEEDDEETIKVVRSQELPAHFKPIIVPNSKPKGKPKACNYGLIQAEGEYVVIYDAEDIPDPNQLKMAVLGFRKAGEKVACIQAKLNYFNRDQNLLTRWFTTEYSMWFDLFIPGLDASNCPIPLGGTSNHFRTAHLKQLGAWDPYNVTEDADLGVRLFKAGGKTAVIDSTTYEEANCEVYNWIRQRSRWVKGYMQTWLVHMRHPIKLIREIGLYPFFSFNMVVGGTFFGFLMNPIYWFITAIWFTTQWTLIQEVFPRPIFYLGCLALYVGNFAFMYTNVAGCMRRQYYDMVKYALISPLYWALMSVGAWKGFIQLLYKPSYWEKTKHGLYRGEIKTQRVTELG